MPFSPRTHHPRRRPPGPLRDRVRAAVTAALAPAAIATAGAPALDAQLPARAAEQTEDVAQAAGAAGDIAYWTPARMAAARDADPLVEPAGPVPSAQDADPAGGSSIGQEEASARHAPVSYVGRVFFSMNGVDSACTGAAVRSPSSEVFSTAGHCLQLAGHTASRVVFYPGYAGAASPGDGWVMDTFEVTAAWRTVEDRSHDAAFVKVLPHRSVFGFARLLAVETRAPAVQFALAKAGLHYEAFGYNTFVGRDTTPLLACSGVGSAVGGGDGGLALPDCAFVGGSSGGPVYHSVGGVRGAQVGVARQLFYLHGGGTETIFVPFGAAELTTFSSVDAAA